MRLLNLLFFLVSAFCACQDYEITYEKYADNDNEIIVDPGAYVLKISKDKSSFRAVNANYLYPDDDTERLSLSFHGKGVVIHDMKNKQVSYNTRNVFGGEIILVESKSIAWNITHQQRKINGISCFKATAMVGKNKNFPGMFMTAWFAPSIPIATGPAGLTGLPGLILLLYDADKKTLSVKMIKKLEKGTVVLHKLPNLPSMPIDKYEEKVMQLVKSKYRN